jgi:MFS family permease
MKRTLADVREVLSGSPGGVIATIAISGCGFGMLQLALPLHLHAIHASPTEIGITLAMFGTGMFVFEFMWGWIADRFGVPGPLIASCLLLAVTAAGFVVATSVPELAALYLLSSGMMVAGGPLGRSFLGVSLPPGQRGLAIGVLQAGWSFSGAIGAGLAGFLGDRFGLQAVFDSAFVFPVVGLVIAVLTFRGQYRLKLVQITPAGAPAAPERPFRYSYALVIISVVVMLSLVGFSGEAAFVPILVTGKLLRDPGSAGLAMSILGIATGILMIPCGKLSDRYGRKPVVVVGMAFAAAGLAGYAVAGSFTFLLAVVLLRALASALAWPAATALLADSVPRSRQGLAMAIYGEFENVGQATGPALAGMIWAASGIDAAFWALAGVVLLGAIIGLALLDETGWRRRAADAGAWVSAPVGAKS